MPIYEFENTDTGKCFEKLLSFDGKDEYLKATPNVKQRFFTAPATVGGHGDRVKIDDGFKSVLSKVGEAFPGSDLDRKVNTQTVKGLKTREIVKKHMDIQDKKK